MTGATSESGGRFRPRIGGAWLGAVVAVGLMPAAAAAGAAHPAAPSFANMPLTTETLTFPKGRVTVLRGLGRARAAARPAPPPLPGQRVETVRFANPDDAPVTVIRGAAAAFGFGLFRPASPGELDRVAFAVEGVESGHGTNPLMWRPLLDGPQGPMQVSAAAALNVGGGDRFDIGTNRVLGRAFLAEMYRRYGNWPDALAAYNWGPGHLDAWIAAGRPEDRLPLETQRYIDLVLGDAVVGKVRVLTLR